MVAAEEGNVSRIVVGVDGSPAADEALRWAIGQARLTGAAVEAVIAWEYAAGASGFGMAPAAGFDASFAEAAEKIIADAISNVADQASGLQVRGRAVFGNPAHVLLEAARDADLLVVGSRGHGGFAGVLLGSVGQHVVHHAPCPVVIIRGHQPH
jgi:nucleotide-binding universal stress UspA family protein